MEACEQRNCDRGREHDDDLLDCIEQQFKKRRALIRQVANDLVLFGHKRFSFV